MLVKGQEIIANEELLAQLEIFRLEKKGLRRHENCLI